MILFISNSGESFPIVWRLKREGTDARIYIHSSNYKKGYAGLLPRVNLGNLKKTIKEAEIVVFDITRPNEKTPADTALLKMFGLSVKSSSVFGPVADVLRKKKLIIGTSGQAEELELDRDKGIRLAKKVGFAIPDSHTFKDLASGAKFLRSRKDLWVFKPHDNLDLDLTYVEKHPGELLTKMVAEYPARIKGKITYLLQKKIEGTELSTEIWKGKNGIRGLNHTIESKTLITGDLGLRIGSQSNTVWQNTTGLLRPQLEAAAKSLGSYVGPLDVNCIMADGIPYFLEWTPRFGYDAIYCMFAMMNDTLTNFFTKDFDVKYHRGYGVSERISIPPYPYDSKALLKTYARDVSILNNLNRIPFFWGQDIYLNDDRLACAGSDGILGIVTGRGATTGGAWSQCYRNIKKLNICSYIQHRMDGHKVAEKRIKNLNLGAEQNG